MLRGLKCLIVEHDDSEARRLARILQAEGHRSHVAPTLPVGLEELGRQDYDLLIAEMTSPATDGPALFKAVREELGREDTAVIVVGPEPPSVLRDQFDTLDCVRAPLPEQQLQRSLRWLHQESAAVSPMNDGEYTRMQLHLQKVSGLVFDAKRRNTLETALRRRMRIIGCSSFPEYFARLLTGDHAGAEEQRLVRLLTVGETSFLRNPAHFDALRKEILPALRRERTLTDNRRIRIWSAGCSTGEEPYTLAMVALDVFPDADRWDIRIRGTDINLRSLATAKRGCYTDRALRTLPDSYKARFFESETDGRFRIRQRVRNLIEFGVTNLQTDRFPLNEDIIFCRNVLIYFNREHYEKAICRMRNALRPGGVLFLGHSENLLGMDVGLRPVHKFDTYFYRRPDTDELALSSRENDDELEEAPSLPPPRPRPVSRSIIPPSRPRSRSPEAAALQTSTERSMLSLARTIGTPGAEDTSEAGREFQSLLDQQSGSPHELVGRGFLAANRGDRKEARRCAEQALKKNTLLAEAHFLLGVVQLDAGETSDAVESFNRALFLEPENPVAHYHLAHIWAQGNREPAARRSYQNAIELLVRGVAPDFHGGFSKDQLLTMCRQGLESLESSGGRGF